MSQFTWEEATPQSVEDDLVAMLGTGSRVAVPEEPAAPPEPPAPPLSAGELEWP